MLAQFLVALAVLQGLALLRAMRVRDPTERASTLLGFVGCVLTGAALQSGRHDLAFVALSWGVVVQGVPIALMASARWALAHQRTVVAARLFGVRALLIPSKRHRHEHAVVQAMALQRTEGLDASLAALRALASETEDARATVELDEQLITMLLADGRWGAGVRHYEARFQLGYVAYRPALAVRLLQAYAELANLERAAAVLRTLEEGPLGDDLRAAEHVGRARLVFLSYAGRGFGGATAPATEVLGLSPARTLHLEGVRASRAGDAAAARTAFEAAVRAAREGEHSVRIHSRSALEDLRAAPVEPVALAPELEAYADAVGTRLRNVLSTVRVLGARRAPRVTRALLFAMGVGFLATAISGSSAYAVVEAGAATPMRLHAGQWWRWAPSCLLTPNAVVALMNLYALWITAPVVERARGPRTLMAAASLGGLAGAAMHAALFTATDVAPIPGAQYLCIGVLAATLVTLTGQVAAELPEHVLRGLRVTTSLLLGAQLAMLPVWSQPAPILIASGVAAACGLLVAGIARGLSTEGTRFRVLRGLGTGWGAVLALACAVGLARVDDAVAYELRYPAVVDERWGVELRGPATFTRFETAFDRADVKLPPGLLDRYSVPPTQVRAAFVAPWQPDTPSLVVALPGLARELHGVAAADETWSAVAEALGGAGDLRATRWTRNGEDVALTLERRVQTQGGAQSVTVIVQPPSLVRETPRITASILTRSAAVPP